MIHSSGGDISDIDNFSLLTRLMKSGIHPAYEKKAVITCGCGAVITTGSTKSAMNIDVCGNCHPFYTGKKKRIDSTGRVDRFEKLSKKAEGLKTTAKPKKVKRAEKSQRKDEKISPPEEKKAKK